MTVPTMKDVFAAPTYPKPRRLRQTWLKDVGYDEAPQYIERMGLAELEDFLEVAAERLDYVKIVTSQVIFSPHDWLKRKIDLYQRFAVEPYLDHSFFMRAYQRGVVESAIEAGRGLGFRVIEFMNTTDEVSASQWKAWRRLAHELGMRIIQEHHPLYHWDRRLAPRAATADEILRGAAPALEDGAFIVMIDHEEFDLQRREYRARNRQSGRRAGARQRRIRSDIAQGRPDAVARQSNAVFQRLRRGCQCRQRHAQPGPVR